MIGYGFLGGHKLESLARIPLAHEATIIARCQSARSVHGRAAEAWSYEESAAWLRNAARVKRHGVTVPQPLCRSAQENTPTPVECAQAGSPLPSGVSCDREHEHTAGRQSQSLPRIPQPAPDDEAGWDEYMRRAFAGEIEPF